MADSVEITTRASVTTVALNRPAKLNAFDAGMRVALLAALEATAADPACRVVVLRGNGNGFSAGQDLADVPADADLGQLLATGYAPIVRLIRTMPKPVVCAVQGVAAGAGANLALGCDIVLAAETARFIQAFVRIGLLPDVGGTWLLPRLVGNARARAAALLGQPIDGRQAAEWGMVYRAVPAERLDAETDAVADALAALPAGAIAAIKRAFDAAATATFDVQLDTESALQGELGRSADFLEGRQAFVEKRPPRFAGVVS